MKEYLRVNYIPYMLTSMKKNNPTEYSECSDGSKIPKTSSIATQVTERKANYDSKIATEKGLLKLGEQTAYIKEKNRQWSIKYEYLNSIANELRDFDEIKFINRLRNFTTKSQTFDEVYKLVEYVSNSNKLHKHHLEYIDTLKKKIISKQLEVNDWEEMADQYMNELEEVEQELKKVKINFKEHKKAAEYKFRTSGIYIKCFSIGNIIAVFMAVGWLVYSSYIQ
jgi:hypothetical protein